jgi:hypothetical protein
LLLAITFQTVACPPEKLGFVNPKLGVYCGPVLRHPAALV